MDILGPHTSSVTIPLRSISTVQDINDGAQPVIVGSGGSDGFEVNIDQPRSRDDVGYTTGDRLSEAEARTRASFS